jgi:hypothetical protein
LPVVLTEWGVGVAEAVGVGVGLTVLVGVGVGLTVLVGVGVGLTVLVGFGAGLTVLVGFGFGFMTFVFTELGLAELLFEGTGIAVLDADTAGTVGDPCADGACVWVPPRVCGAPRARSVPAVNSGLSGVYLSVAVKPAIVPTVTKIARFISNTYLKRERFVMDALLWHTG